MLLPEQAPNPASLSECIPARQETGTTLTRPGAPQQGCTPASGAEQADARFGQREALTLRANNVEDFLHSRQVKDLLHGRLGIQQPDPTFRPGSGFLETDQRAKSAAIDERGSAKIDIDVSMPVLQGGTRRVPESSR